MDITVQKHNDFHKWYNQLLTNCNFIKYTDIPGCYILLPNSFSIWENIKNHLDVKFKSLDVQNTYFPLFITKNNLEKESNHITDFKPEVAWVTQTGNTQLDENKYLAIRPTSETAIYSALPELITSHNDLPLKYNQWCNVVRWEFKDPTPFIRSREFLWNEGHTCYATQNEALFESQKIVSLYNKTYNDILAVPTIVGIKTNKEKFAGAIRTHTIESFVPEVGRGIQCCTVHNLGQNFSKMFNIQYIDKNNIKQFVWQNSWGFTTRSIGTMLMIHGDDQGAIIPPKIASIQMIIVPILFKNKKDIVNEYVKKVCDVLRVKYKVDNGDHNPGWKYNYWERLGVPLRMEVGPRDAKNGEITVVKRNTGERITFKFDENINDRLNDILDNIQQELYENAKKRMIDCIERPGSWEQFENAIGDDKMCLIPWCNDVNCENDIKEKTFAKSLCIPTDIEYILNKVGNCVHCGKMGTTICLFGKSY